MTAGGFLRDAHGRPPARSGEELDVGTVTRVEGGQCWMRPFDRGDREIGPCQLPSGRAVGHPSHEAHPADPEVVLTPDEGDEVVVLVAANVMFAIPFSGVS